MKRNRPVTQQEATYPDAANILSTTDLGGKITYANEDFQNISNIQGLSETNLIMADKSSQAGKRMHAIARSFTELAAQFWKAKRR